MPRFEALSHRSQVRLLRGLAANALAHYDLSGEPTFRLLLHLANTTFRVRVPDGSQYVLRISQPGFRTPQAIRSEAMWLDALRRDTDLGVPQPVYTRDGDLLAMAGAEGVPEARVCVLYRWLEGTFRRRRLGADSLRLVGVLTARLHDHVQTFRPPPGFTRPVGEVSRLVGGWRDDLGEAHRLVPLEDQALFYTAADRIQAEIAHLGDGPDRFGLIHTDLHHGNYLFHDGEARAIDFDDASYEHLVYDLATTLWALQPHRKLPALQAALFEGYESVRPLPPGWDTHLTTFIAARYLLVSHYVVSRAADNPGLRQMAPRYVRVSADFVRRYMDT